MLQAGGQVLWAAIQGSLSSLTLAMGVKLMWIWGSRSRKPAVVFSSTHGSFTLPASPWIENVLSALLGLSTKKTVPKNYSTPKWEHDVPLRVLPVRVCIERNT